MVRAGPFGREQKKYQVDRLAIERLEIDANRLTMLLAIAHRHAALALPGVIGVLTPDDVAAMSNPIGNMVSPKLRYYPCAVDRARYFGEPIAVVVADSRYIAEDAVDLIEVNYDPKPAVVTIEDALAPSSTSKRMHAPSLRTHKLVQTSRARPQTLDRQRPARQRPLPFSFRRRRRPWTGGR